MTQIAQSGDTVRVRFTGRLDDGTVFDSSSRRGPLEITLGAGDVIPGVDRALRGLEVGERRSTRIPPREGFGQRRDDLVLTVAKDEFPGDDPKPGEGYELRTESGPTVRVRVLRVFDQVVEVDANHPLAGQPLNFELELVGIQ